MDKLLGGWETSPNEIRVQWGPVALPAAGHGLPTQSAPQEARQQVRFLGGRTPMCLSVIHHRLRHRPHFLAGTSTGNVNEEKRFS